jgi:hypothetical protein
MTKNILDINVVKERLLLKRIELVSGYVGASQKARCRCYCGKEFEVVPAKVFCGHTKSCGCAHSGCTIKNLVGKTFGRLKVIQLAGVKHECLWKCICECGQEKILSTGVLTSGHTKSCGCLMYQYNKGSSNYKWKGFGEISARLWYRYKNNARIRNIKFSITGREAWEQFVKQNGRCALTGDEISFGSFSSDSSGTASLDRIDSKVGYTVNNIHWVHKTINDMKWDMALKEFFEWCYLISYPKNIVPSLHCKEVPQFSRGWKWKGHGNISGTIWWYIVNSAKSRNIPIKINSQYLWELFLKQQGCCSVTGVPLLLYPRKEVTASLDRIDNNLGYIPNNVQWVHKIINTKIRKYLDLKTVREFAKKVIFHEDYKSN